MINDVAICADDFVIRASEVVEIISDRQSKSVEQKIFDKETEKVERKNAFDEKLKRLTDTKTSLTEKRDGYVFDLKVVSDELEISKNAEGVKEKVLDTLTARKLRVNGYLEKHISLIKDTNKKISDLSNDFALKQDYLQSEIDELKITGSKTDFDLSKGAMTHCEEWVINEKLKRRIEVSTKSMQKGKEVEEDSIKLLHQEIYQDFFICEKNEVEKTDGLKKGTCDIDLGDEDGLISDAKNLYTHESLKNVFFKDEIPDKGYWWQVVVYCSLWKKKRGEVVYILMNMPEHMIRDLARVKLPYGYSESEYEKFAKNYKYDDVPIYMRIKRFKVEFTQSDIDRIDYKIGECRRYISYLLTKLDNHIKNKYLE